LLYSSDYHKIMSTLWSARRSVFSRFEPIVWVYRREGFDDILLSNFRKHLRVWIQPKSNLEGTHIVLDAIRNNSLFTNLKRFKLPGQNIELEGNFPSYFKLYCQPGKQVIALQIIAPDVMTFIIDNAMEVDIEIIDQQIALIYRNGAKDEDSIRLAVELITKMGKLQSAVQKVVHA